MYDASCEAKKATVAATSSGLPSRFIGTCVVSSLAKLIESFLGYASPTEDRCFNRARRNRVHADATSNKPAAAVLARERSAALVAEYALNPAFPFWSATPVLRMLGLAANPGHRNGGCTLSAN